MYWYICWDPSALCCDQSIQLNGTDTMAAFYGQSQRTVQKASLQASYVAGNINEWCPKGVIGVHRREGGCIVMLQNCMGEGLLNNVLLYTV